MSLGELIPIVGSLSRFDKLRLIQILADDLVRSEESLFKPTEGSKLEVGDNGHADDELVREAIHAMVLRNAIGRAEEEVVDPSEADRFVTSHQGVPNSEVGPDYPYWSSDREAEAAAILMRMLEAEKSTS